MTEEIYPDKDIMYMPEKTPVYVVANPRDPREYGSYLETKRSFEQFGYRDVRLQESINGGWDRSIHINEFPFIGFPESTDIDRRNWLTHLRLWKKCVGLGAPIIVTHWSSKLIKDIPNNRSEEGIFGLGSKIIPGTTRKGINIQRGYVIYPKQANGLLSWARKRGNLPQSVSYTLWNEYAGMSMTNQIFRSDKEYVVPNEFKL